VAMSRDRGRPTEPREKPGENDKVALARERTLLASVMQATDVMLVYLDRDFNFVWVNAAYATTSRRTPEELLGKNHFVLYPHAENEAIFRRVRDTGEPVFYKDKPFEFPDQPERGVTYWDWSLVPVKDASGAVQGLVFSLRETTNYRRAEAERERLAQQRQLALDAARMGWWHYDPATGNATYDDRFAEIFGVSGHERSREDILKLLHPDDLPRVWAAAEGALDPADPRLYSAEYRVNHPDGGMRWVEAHGLAEFGGEGPGRRATTFVGTVADITERKRAEEAVRESEERFRIMADSSPMILWVTGEDGGLRFANRTYREFFGVTYEQVQGGNWQPLVHPDDVAEYVRGFLRCLRERRPFIAEARVRRADGEWRWIASHGVPRSSSGGEFLGYVGVSSDITERKRAEEALHEANLQLAETDRRKNEFLAVLSHELRNPLAPIRYSLHILQRAVPGSEQSRRAQEVLDRQTLQLTRLVDDLLDVTRVSRDKIHLQRRPLDLNDLVRRTVDDHRSLFEEAGIGVRATFAGEHLPITGDPARLAQVVGNLLHNAAKFTPAGGQVGVATECATSRSRAMLRITDTGAGMEPAMLRRLFQPFMQADTTLDRTSGGLGLGLALVKGLVEMHGGEVRAHSDGPGKGAEFVVELPLDSTAIEETGAVAAAARRGRRVLVIEDNVDAADSLRAVLEFQEHLVEVACDGPEGLAKAREFKPDVVLCDIGLPGMDGFEVARAFRSDESLSGIVLVALSGYALPEDLQRATDAGFQRHLAKPASPEKLEQVLAELPPPSVARNGAH
jgi:PAS domain S-box-containing protein